MNRVPFIICLAIHFMALAGLAYFVLSLLVVPFWRRMRKFVFNHSIVHIVGFICVAYWVSGSVFCSNHTSGGSVMILHAARTPLNKCLAAFYRPWFMLEYGISVREDPMRWDVAYHEMNPVPQIRGSSSKLTLYLGALIDSPSSNVWVLPVIRAGNGSKVYISAYLVGRGSRTNAFDILIQQTDTTVAPAAFWMDPDGSYVPILIKQ